MIIFSIFLLLSVASIAIGVILLIFRVIFKKGPRFKKILIVIASSIVVFIISGINLPEMTPEQKAKIEQRKLEKEQAKIDKVEAKKKEKALADEEKKQKLIEKENIKSQKEKERKQKELAEAEQKKIKKEEKKKAAEENKKREEQQKDEEYKKIYLNETKPEIDRLLASYDWIWTDMWTPAFEGMSNGSINFSQGYQQMKAIEIRYNNLHSIFGKIPTKTLNKNDKKNVELFKSYMQEASLARKSAAKKTSEMLYSGDYSSSNMIKIDSDISKADEQLIKAIAEIAIVEQKYNIKR